MQNMSGFLRLLVLFAGLVLAGGAWAQSDRGASRIETLDHELSAIVRTIAENTSNDEKLVSLRLRLEEMSKSLIDFGVSFRPELKSVNARLAELGSAPKDGDPPEPDVMTLERNDLLARKAAINGFLSNAESMSIRINEAMSRIGDLRRDLFANTLLRRTDSTGVFNADTLESFQLGMMTAQRLFVSRIQFIWNFRKDSLFAAAGLSLLFSFGAWLAFRRAFAPMLFHRRGHEASYFNRISIAFFSTFVPALTVTAALGVTYALTVYFGIFAGQSLAITRSFLIAIAGFFFIQRLVIAVVAPRRPGLRLAPFTNSASWRLATLAIAMAAVHIADIFFDRLNQILSAPLPVTVAESMIAAILIGMLIVMIALVKPLPDKQTGRSRPWPVAIRVPMILLAGFVIVAAALGYVGLARFMAAQIVITGAILATMLIGIQTGRAASEDGALAGSSVGARLSSRFSLSETALDQIGVALALCIYLLVVLIGAPLIALQWGFNWIDITSTMYRLFTSITIGSFSISLFAILLGVFVFFVGMLVTRRLQHWLDRNVMAKSRVDSGVRNSIRTVTGYAGVAVAALIGISVAGFDLSNLAIVAGALSLGIGFGLQNIVNNFVSGLILLVERPFKVGDWVVTGSTTGMVRRISVRATEIETFQKQTVILPNSELINSSVGNWTHRNHLGRIDIAVGVAYGSDPRFVHGLLMEIAEADRSVLKVPAPMAVFVGFGDSSLDFELRVHIQDVFEGLVVSTRLRFAIFEAFKEHGVEIPFPQRDINIRTPQAHPPQDPSHPEVDVAREPANVKTPPEGGWRDDDNDDNV